MKFIVGRCCNVDGELLGRYLDLGLRRRQQQVTGENYVIRSSFMISLRRMLSQESGAGHAWEKKNKFIQRFDGKI